ncbi:nitrile hydratase subunit alpha [Roseococcus pinisoli]|uniref:Nitrile hydratase subunit alpha n=1 Tax=Roseococcus pinisoli TaxID=2835040 RepID=A0ABS5QEJ8_9PROT|nr:nitrile hydratase subunit alpha [Roseococcus pinisoli]MBS7811355.1 nitrile hydratase subunit alpha [Roseococcus pinisoli]
MVATAPKPPAPIEQRTAALEIVLKGKGILPDGFVEEFTEHAEDEWVTSNGGQMVARAWTDPEYRERMLKDGTAAAREMGFDFPEHHRQLVVLENTPDIHNLIVCTLCSCTAYTIIGAAPDWYKDMEYRARVVRESRTALREMGLDLPATTEIRVWDTTADTRYMVLPVQPPATAGWPAEKLAPIVTQDSMIGASRLDEVKG